MPDFFMLTVHLDPEIPAEEMLRAANRFGYKGIGICSEHAEPARESGIYRGVEIRTNSVSELKRKLRRYWSKVPLLAVRGGDKKLNMAAVKDYRVDVLTNPCGEDWRGELKPQMLELAARNGIAIEFNLSAIIGSRRGERAHILRQMHENLELMRKYGVMPLLATDARSIYDLRAPREMIAIAALYGMEREEAIRALSEIPAGILTRRWKKGREVERL